MSGQDDIERTRASVVENSARHCRQAFDFWLAEPNPLRRESVLGAMRGHEMTVNDARRRENAELRAQLEALRGERDRVVQRLAAKPKLRLAAPEEGNNA